MFNCSRSPLLVGVLQKLCSCIDRGRGESHMVRPSHQIHNIPHHPLCKWWQKRPPIPMLFADQHVCCHASELEMLCVYLQGFINPLKDSKCLNCSLAIVTVGFSQGCCTVVSFGGYAMLLKCNVWRTQTPTDALLFFLVVLAWTQPPVDQ